MAIPSVNPFSQQPGGGVATAMRGDNALSKELLETAYYPATQQAQIAAQNAYAQNLPLQNLATVLSNPNLYAAADKGLVNNLLNRYGEMAANPPSVQSLAGGNKMGGGLLSKFIDTISGNSGGNALNQSQPPQQGGGNPFAQQSQQGGGADSGYSYSGDGRNITDPNYPGGDRNPPSGAPAISATPVNDIPVAGQSSTPGLPSTKVERIAAGSGAGDTRYGGVNPSSVSQAQGAGLTATATGEAGAQVEQQKLMETNDISAANEAVQQQQLLNKAEQLHKNIPQWQRGKIFGTLVPDILTGSEATELDTTMQNVVASVKKQQETGNAGVAGIQLATASKPNRSMPDKAFKDLITYNKGMNDRIMEKPSFNQAMFSKGYTPAEVATMWLYYQTKRPFYDAEHHLKDDANLGTWDKFYATPGRRDAAFSPTAAKQIEKVMGTKAPGSDANIKPGQIALKGGLIVPESFDSQEHFNEWWNKQPKSTQLAYQEHLKGKQ